MAGPRPACRLRSGRQSRGPERARHCGTPFQLTSPDHTGGVGPIELKGVAINLPDRFKKPYTPSRVYYAGRRNPRA